MNALETSKELTKDQPKGSGVEMAMREPAKAKGPRRRWWPACNNRHQII